MTFPAFLTACMVVFMFVGALDHVFGNRFGLGEQFLRGFEAFGSLAVTMTGVLVLLPYVERYLGPVITPLWLMEAIHLCCTAYFSTPP